jgi:hypothetical protein
MEIWSGFIGALLGGLIAGGANFLLQRRQHDQEIRLQTSQFEHDNAERRAEWENQRQERARQLEEDRERERQVRVNEALRELQLVMPVFSRAARAMYEEKRSLYLEAKEKGAVSGTIDATPGYIDSASRLDDLDQQVRDSVSRIDNEKIRTAANQLYEINRHMALLAPSTWDSTRLYAGQDPVLLLVPRQHQLTRMIGKVLSGRSIDDEVVEPFVHGDGIDRHYPTNHARIDADCSPP